MGIDRDLRSELQRLLVTGKRLEASFRMTDNGTRESNTPETDFRSWVASARLCIRRIAGKDSTFEADLPKTIPDRMAVLGYGGSIVPMFLGPLEVLKDQVDRGAFDDVDPPPALAPTPVRVPAMAQPSQNATATIQIGKWGIIRELGRGGQGTVQLVYDSGSVRLPSRSLADIGASPGTLSPANIFDGRPLGEILGVIAPGTVQFGALKRLHAPDQARNAESAEKRLAQELRAFQSVEHPNVLRLLDINQAEKWFVTEYHPRGTLSLAKQAFAGRPMDSLRAFRGLVDAVAALHARNIVHRDIKPDNIFIAQDGRFVLADMGLAFFLEDDGDRLTNTGSNIGTRAWMPPWAINRRVEDVTPDFDVYGLGKVLWAICTGILQPPVDYDAAAITKLNDLPHGRILHSLVSRAWRRDGEPGFRDAIEMLGAIDELSETTPGGANSAVIKIMQHAISRPGPLYLVSAVAPKLPGMPECYPAGRGSSWLTNHPSARANGEWLAGIQSNDQPVGLMDEGWFEFQKSPPECGRCLISPPPPRSFDHWLRFLWEGISLRDARFLQLAIEPLPGCPFAVELILGPSERRILLSPTPAAVQTNQGTAVLPFHDLREGSLEPITRDIRKDAVAAGAGSGITEDELIASSSINGIGFHVAFKLLFARII